MGHKKTDFYDDSDLSVGSIINIFNRKFVLYDCDEFTKEYYRVKYGISKCMLELLICTMIAWWCSVGRMSDLRSRGRGFDSRSVHYQLHGYCSDGWLSVNK